MLQLYYNAAHPIEILDSLVVKPSVCCNRDRGVSMSSRLIDSHGPFTFVFKPARDWYQFFTAVVYDGIRSRQFFKGREGEVSLAEWTLYDFTHKIQDFRDEHEYWTPGPVYFKMEDIQCVIFRENSPGAKIHPIISRRNSRKLREKFSVLVTV